MKIENKLKDNFGLLKTSNKNIGKISGQKIQFLEELKKIHGKDIEGRLDELLEIIDKQGQRLSKNQNFKELIRYKKMVKKFIKSAVEKIYNVGEEYSPMQGKIHTIVKSIDKSLEHLTKAIVDEQSSQLDILSRIDEVRGMLVDLYR